MRDELPDIVLIMLDTARVDRFGCYGYGKPTTPTVDSLARDGVLVDYMISNAPWTLPSHASLFTALYPAQHGAQWNTASRLRASTQLTLAEWLLGLGYETVCATANRLVSSSTGLARGFRRYGLRDDLDDSRKRTRRSARHLLRGSDSGGALLNGWIRSILPSVRSPLFLFVNYLECHWAYTPPNRMVRRIGGPRPGMMEAIRFRATTARRMGPWDAVAHANAEQLALYSSLYDAELATADANLDDLLGILREGGRLRKGNTLVIVTSDHGEHLGEHALADHQASVDDHLIRVPFVAWGPGLLPAGTRQGVFEFVDVLPSLAAFLGRPLPLPVTGRRTNVFEGQSADSTPYAFAEWRSWDDQKLRSLSARNPSFDFDRICGDLLCVTDGHFKLVRRAGSDQALYDLSGEPREEVDVATSYPQETDRLRSELERAMNDWASWEQSTDILSGDDERAIEEHLSDLGYI